MVGGSWVEKVKRLREGDKDSSTVIARGKGGVGEVGEGKRGINGGGKRLDFGESVHNARCR